MTAAGASPLLSRSAGIKVFVCLAGAYLLSYALRSINAAIAPELVAEFSLSNTDLGYLSSAYFLGFAGCGGTCRAANLHALCVLTALYFPSPY